MFWRCSEAQCPQHKFISLSCHNKVREVAARHRAHNIYNFMPQVHNVTRNVQEVAARHTAHNIYNFMLQVHNMTRKVLEVVARF
eukprot:scaffold116225_cov19-Tisochrysis_lutea.AAC.1